LRSHGGAEERGRGEDRGYNGEKLTASCVGAHQRSVAAMSNQRKGD
jgi:hypothetical protein